MRKTRVATWLTPLILLFFIATIAPAIILHTRSYPMTIVEGDSMLPDLHPGDIVVYEGLSLGQTVPSGTIIIYAPVRTGTPILDQMLKPVIIHRIVNLLVLPDGAYYQTKGDNNQSPDGSLVRSDKILGTQLAVIPRAGSAVLFLKSPQGLVAALAILLTTNQSARIKRTGQQKNRDSSALGSVPRPKKKGVENCTCESCLNAYP